MVEPTHTSGRWPGLFEPWRTAAAKVADWFAPASEAIRTAAPQSVPLHQYGAEPILEFLSDRPPATLDMEHTFTDWDGSHQLNNDPPVGHPVAVVDKGQAWATDLRKKLSALGYELVFDSGGELRVLVFKPPVGVSH